MMRRAACLALLAAAVSGCASNAPVVVRTERVEVPVSVPCRTPDIDRPAWALDALPKGADLFQRVRAMAVEIEQRRAYIARLEAAVKSCQ
ncbi:hypothetical protein y223_00005 [Bordetella phage PY223]